MLESLAVLAWPASSAALLPAGGARRTAADPVVLRVGTTQDLDSLNPYSTLLVVGYEVFGLTYNLLVDFGPNLEPVPGLRRHVGARPPTASRGPSTSATA